VVVPTVTLVNFSTMDRDIQSAYSTQGSFEIEQQLGMRSSISAGYQRLRGIHLIASINQNVPTCAAVGNNNGCRPNPAYANNSQYSGAADSVYDGLHVSFVQRPSRWGSYRVSYAWSKSLNNVGEAFFSSPLDPRNIWLDYGRSDDDQRHRVTFNGSLESSQAAAHSLWERLSHGFRLSTMLQYYSALPYNITTGAQTIQGTTARPAVAGSYISRNAGIGNDFFSVGLRLSRAFRLTERWSLEGLGEAFNALNYRNNLTRNGNFGIGAYPANPSLTYGQITAVSEPRSLQFALRLKF
jgi:hypothetical protein